MKIKSVIWLLILLALQFAPANAQRSEKAVAGLGAGVTITRDSRSIPYISAASTNDAYFAQGFATASDRLWQMDLLRRVAAGETAEIFGVTTLNEDKRWRRFGFSAVAAASLPRLSPEIRRALERYADGVNAYITSLDDKLLPVEFRLLQYRPRKWMPTDTILIGKILADALSTTWDDDLLRSAMQTLAAEKLKEIYNTVTPDDVVLFGSDKQRPKLPKRARTIKSVSPSALAQAASDESARERSLSMAGLFAEGLAASNNLVVAGSRTKSGKPILANDPHLQPTAPGIWYMVSLSAPGLRVAGVTLPGVPGVVIGHNRSIAWGMTNVGPDVQDIYSETLDGKGNYKSPEGWRPLTTRIEKIAIRSNPLKPETDVVDFPVYETARGPIIVDDGVKRFSLQWTALKPSADELDAFFKINRAENWNQFQAALSGYGGPAQNFVFADVQGNIGWYAAGAIPIRRKGDGSLPYDGSTSDGDWLGKIEFDQLPHLYNPPGGFIVTANQRTVGTDYAYSAFTRDAAAPWRARRIFDLLKSDQKVDADAVRDIQLDDFNLPVSAFARSVLRLGGPSAETLELLKNWDGRMQSSSAAALFANGLRNCAAEKIAGASAPATASMIREKVLQAATDKESPTWLPPAFDSYASLLKTCDSEIIAGFEKLYGADRNAWVWGKTTRSRFPHPLAAVPLIGNQFATPAEPLAGSRETPNVASFVSMRLITSPGAWDETRQVIPLGESGNPASPFYRDQFELWRTGRAAVFPFSDEAVKTAAVTELALIPEK